VARPVAPAALFRKDCGDRLKRNRNDRRGVSKARRVNAPRLPLWRGPVRNLRLEFLTAQEAGGYTALRGRRRRNPVGVIDQRFEKNFLITSVDYVFNWARKSSLWPLTFGLACCAIEMIASTTARFDMARFGAEVFRPSPRQADLMIVSGTVTLKMAQVIQRVWQQMPDPKWCISMGACSGVGGPFNTYSVLQGVDRIVPVDVYVVGCPPRPEALFYALLKLQDKIDNMTLAKRPTEVRLEPQMVEEFKKNVMVAQVAEPQ
jgi:NADH-quinone oxidoreductase subunit B